MCAYIAIMLEEGDRSHGTGVSDDCDPLCGYLEQNQLALAASALILLSNKPFLPCPLHPFLPLLRYGLRGSCNPVWPLVYSLAEASLENLIALLGSQKNATIPVNGNFLCNPPLCTANLHKRNVCEKKDSNNCREVTLGFLNFLIMNSFIMGL